MTFTTFPAAPSPPPGTRGTASCRKPGFLSPSNPGPARSQNPKSVSCLGIGDPRASFPPPAPLLLSPAPPGSSPAPWSIPAAGRAHPFIPWVSRGCSSPYRGFLWGFWGRVGAEPGEFGGMIPSLSPGKGWKQQDPAAFSPAGGRKQNQRRQLQLIPKFPDASSFLRYSQPQNLRGKQTKALTAGPC